MKPQFTQYQISNIDGEEKHIQYFMKAIDARLQNVWTKELDPQVVSFDYPFYNGSSAWPVKE